MTTLDQRLTAILAAGKRPSITLYPGMEIVVPKGRVGRPRVRDDSLPFLHYADPRASNRRARCLAPGCGKRLRVNQRGACSETCSDAVFNHALQMFRLIGVTTQELIEIFSSSAAHQRSS
jgi:hypothetical protein